VYDELHRIAAGQLRVGGPQHTLNATAVVHEAYFKLVDDRSVDYQHRGHFFAIAARTMRRIVVDRARHRSAQKRGGRTPDVTLDPNEIAFEEHAELILSVHRALEVLEEVNSRLCRVVECRSFAGMTSQETAEALGVSLRTAEREWTRARAWLRKEMSQEAV